jgi:hypothetical protein
MLLTPPVMRLLPHTSTPLPARIMSIMFSGQRFTKLLLSNLKQEATWVSAVSNSFGPQASHLLPGEASCDVCHSSVGGSDASASF